MRLEEEEGGLVRLIITKASFFISRYIQKTDAFVALSSRLQRSWLKLESEGGEWELGEKRKRERDKKKYWEKERIV